MKGTERVVASDRVRVPVIAGHDDLLRLQARVRGFVRPLARQERRASTPRERIEALLLFALPELARLAVPRLLVRVGEILRRAQARRASLVLVPGDGLARGDSGVALLRLRLAALLERDLVPAPALEVAIVIHQQRLAPLLELRATRRELADDARVLASALDVEVAQDRAQGLVAEDAALVRGVQVQGRLRELVREAPELARAPHDAALAQAVRERGRVLERGAEDRGAVLVAAALERLEADVLELGRLARRVRGRDGPLGVLEGGHGERALTFSAPGGARPRGFENEERARRRAGGPGRTPPVPGSDRARRRGARPTSEARSRRAARARRSEGRRRERPPAGRRHPRKAASS